VPGTGKVGEIAANNNQMLYQIEPEFLIDSGTGNHPYCLGQNAVEPGNSGVKFHWIFGCEIVVKLMIPYILT
jgi:hypothetical protein